jgi:hypothetical protein
MESDAVDDLIRSGFEAAAATALPDVAVAMACRPRPPPQPYRVGHCRHRAAGPPRCRRLPGPCGSRYHFDMFDGVLMALIGAFVSLVGYRVIALPMRPGMDGAAWLERHGTLFRVGGPLIVAIGAGLFVADLVR